MSQQYKARFKDADWASETSMRDIVIGGVGNIGSWTSLFLSRIGHRLHLFDPDGLEDVNIAGQCYFVDNIGNSKVTSIWDICRAMCGNSINIDYYEDRYTEHSMVTPVMISGFDNMEARRVMFNNWKSQEDRELFIDGRVSAEVGMIYFVTKGREDAYEATLFPDSAVADAPCSFKSTSHCGAFIASLMVNGLNSYLGNIAMEMDIRSLPFEVDFQLPTFNIQCNNVPQVSSRSEKLQESDKSEHLQILSETIS